MCRTDHPPVKNKFNSFIDKTKIYLGKSATSFTSAMTILCSIIMCFKSLSCSATGKCSSQKIQGTHGGPSKAVEPPGLSGRESGSRIQSFLSGRGTKEEERKLKPTLALRATIFHLLHWKESEGIYKFKNPNHSTSENLAVILNRATVLLWKNSQPCSLLEWGNPFVEVTGEVFFMGPGQWVQLRVTASGNSDNWVRILSDHMT